MAIIDMGRMGDGGVNKDLAQYDLPPNVFTDVLNVDFENGAAVPAVMEQGVFYGTQGNPLYLTFVETLVSDAYPVYLTADKGFAIVGSTHMEITNPDGLSPASTYFKWNGGFFHGTMVWTNGREVPQTWDPYNPSNPMKDLEGWPSSVRVGLIRPYSNFLVGFVYTNQDGEFSAQTLIWSDAADPNTLPNWDITDPASKAGAFSLTTTSDSIVDAVELRGEMMIYRQYSVWSMRYVGGTFVMSFNIKFSERGLLAPRCVVALEGSHFCIDRNGFYTHNGVNVHPIGDKVLKDYFFDTLNMSRVESTFVEYEEAKNRVWIFYPTGTNVYANRVLIFDLANGTWTIREVQQAACAARGSMASYGTGGIWDQFNDIWEDDPAAWALDEGVWSAASTWDTLPVNVLWDDFLGKATQRSIHYMSNVNPANVEYNAETQTSSDGFVTWIGASSYPPMWYIAKNGLRAQGLLERLNLSVLEKDDTGSPSVSRTLYKHLTELYPEVLDYPVEIRWGTQNKPKSIPDWSDWVLFNPEEDIKLDPNITDRFLAIALRGAPNTPYKWRFTGLTLNLNKAGMY